MPYVAIAQAQGKVSVTAFKLQHLVGQIERILKEQDNQRVSPHLPSLADPFLAGIHFSAENHQTKERRSCLFLRRSEVELCGPTRVGESSLSSLGGTRQSSGKDLPDFLSSKLTSKVFAQKQGCELLK